MKKPVNATIEVQGAEITILKTPEGDFISLTDMLKAKDGEFFISDWLRNRNTIAFLGIWESVDNPDFNSGESATIKSQAGLNSYKLSVKEWVEKTGAVGLKTSAGRYGGTYAHKDITYIQLPSASRLIKLNGSTIRQIDTLTASTTRLLEP